MKEVGYEWDNINKKLKKIDSPVLSNSSNTGKDEPTKWSEEDEKNLQGIIDLLPGLTIRHNWLKSLKDRIEG